MATTLFVAKLSFNTTKEDLQALFEQYGSVSSAHIATDRETSKSRGFGFVEMEQDNDALKAIRALDGKPFQDRMIAVSVARPREERTPNNGSFKSGFQRR